MSEWVETGLPCNDCGSSDALAINDRGWSKCFSCDKSRKTEGNTNMTDEKQISNKASSGGVSSTTATLLANVPLKPQGMTDRLISPATVKKFGVVVQGDRHIYPMYAAEDLTKLVAAKKRMVPKAFISEGNMASAALFGQQAFPAGGRNIVITEGECDAMAVYQLQGSKYPSVSVRSATSALNDCKRNYMYLDSFDSVIVCFDNDTAGRKASEEVAELFAGKSKVMEFVGYKDACDVLQDGAKGTAEWKRSFWNAPEYTPDGIVAGTALWDTVSTPLEKAPVQYPWPDLNKTTYGVRSSELVTVAAGSGLGKSQWCREVMQAVLDQTDWKVGGMFLEEGTRKTGLSLMSLAANKPLHLPMTECSDAERKAAYDATLGTGRIYLFDSFGSNSIENILSRIRYMAKALDCKAIFLDHISIIVSSGENGDERKAIDEIMTKLATIVDELGIALFVVSHLKRPSGAGHEEGEKTTLSQLRGSGSIAQLSDIVIGLERNGQSDDMTERNTTRMRVLKNRFSGETGLAAAALYDFDTGRMNAIEDVQTTPIDELEGAL